MGRSWAEFGSNRPALRKLIIFGLVLTTIFILLGGISTSGVLPKEYDAKAKEIADAATDRWAKGWAGFTNGS